jgi:hypothetical protein
MTGWALTLLFPSVLWALGHLLSQRAFGRPTPAVSGIAGFLAPAGLMRYCGRPFPEQLIAWAVSVVAWAGAFVIRDPQVFIAFGLVGAVWGFALGFGSTRLATAVSVATRPPQPDIAASDPARAPRDKPEEPGFRVELACPTCGAALAVPVYHRMAKCEFCGSVHVVAGPSETLACVIPDAITDQDALKASVLRHLAHRRYLTLYDQRVRPLVADTGFGAGEHEYRSDLLPRDRTPAFVNAADAEVTRAAEAYAAKIAPRLVVRGWRRFLAPYWHRFGTLYQAAFGRDAEGLKRMEFAVVTIEGSAAASRAPLPPMGKLSYLRALRPLVGAPEATLPALPAELGVEEIDRGSQQLDRRSVELPIKAIAIHATLVPEVVALVYRPWHVASLELDEATFELLIDGGSGTVEGDAPALDVQPGALTGLAAQVPTLAPSRCPECGADLPFAPDADAHLCRNCFRLVAIRRSRWAVIPYAREEPAPGSWQVPFWRFPLRLRTAAGEVIVDLPHLTDGIDGSYDQIGERAQVQQTFCVPAFRTRVSRAGVKLYRALWPLLRDRAPELTGERFSPARPPERIVDVTLPAAEARVFARVYLALAFTQRDLARAQVKSVRERFLTGQLEGEPQLVYLNLAQEVIGPVTSLLGRAQPAALTQMEGGTTLRT